jgi:BatD DUF11 like domain
VVSTARRRFAAALLTGTLAAAVHAQDVVVTASVDRTNIRANESFTYVVRAEGRVRGEPDISAVERQFDLLSRSSSTRIEIVNGQTRQIADWQYQLIPQREGRFTLPPVSVDGVSSNPVEIEVLPATASVDELPDIFIDVEADQTSPYVQSQVLYTLRLYLGVATGRKTLTAPQVEGGEAIVERLGEDRQYQSDRNGRSYTVVERRYAIFPQQAGPLTIGPATFEAMVIPSRGFSRVQRLRSDSTKLDVRPAVPPPAEYPNAAWLPAKSLRLTEQWADDATDFELGVPRTRTLTIDAEGLLETQLPELEVGQADGVRQYPDQPQLDRRVSDAGLSSSRVERYAVIAQNAGKVEIPGASVPWWNIGTETWEVASIEPRTVFVAPGAEPEEAAPPPSTPPPAAAAEPRPNYWKAVSAVLALGWAVTALLWLRARNRPTEEPAQSTARPAPKRATNRQILRRLRAACRNDDAEAAQSSLMDWAALRLDDDPPQSLGALADKLPDTAAREVLRLEAHLYGRDGEAWDGRALAAALSGIDSVSRKRSSGDEDPLLPLYR